MTPKEKAVKLVKISFDKIAIKTNYKGVLNDKGKQFGILNELSKSIALDYVNEVLNILFQHHEIDYWKEVKQEIQKTMKYIYPKKDNSFMCSISNGTGKQIKTIESLENAKKWVDLQLLRAGKQQQYGTFKRA